MNGSARPGLLWVLFGLQLFCAVFFVLDAVLDFLDLEAQSGNHNLDPFEYVIAAALFLGVILTGRELRRLMRQSARLKDQVRIASGQFAELLEEHFDNWGLTASERDVAILAIKGLSVSDIAAARGTTEGTVKAHNAALYRKAGVSGRLQLLSLFIDELMDGA